MGELFLAPGAAAAGSFPADGVTAHTQLCVHALGHRSYLGCAADCRRRRRHPTPVLLPGKSHGQRSLVGYSPCDHKELDTTE